MSEEEHVPEPNLGSKCGPPVRGTGKRDGMEKQPRNTSTLGDEADERTGRGPLID